MRESLHISMVFPSTYMFGSFLPPWNIIVFVLSILMVRPYLHLRFSASFPILPSFSRRYTSSAKWRLLFRYHVLWFCSLFPYFCSLLFQGLPWTLRVISDLLVWLLCWFWTIDPFLHPPWPSPVMFHLYPWVSWLICCPLCRLLELPRWFPGPHCQMPFWSLQSYSIFFCPCASPSPLLVSAWESIVL